MATNTDKLNLIKPEESDFADINQLNTNFDTIDNYAKQLDAEFDKKVDKIAGKGLSTNDFTDVHAQKVNIIQLKTETAQAGKKIDPDCIHRDVKNVRSFPFPGDVVVQQIQNDLFGSGRVSLPNLKITSSYYKDPNCLYMFDNTSPTIFQNIVMTYRADDNSFYLLNKKTADHISVGAYSQLITTNEQDITVYDFRSTFEMVTFQGRVKTDFTGYKRAYIFVTDKKTNVFAHAYDNFCAPGSYIAFTIPLLSDRQYRVQSTQDTLQNLSIINSSVYIENFQIK